MAEARQSINNVIVTIAWEFKWEPRTISRLFWNKRKDYDSAIFWYDEIMEYRKEAAKAK